MPGPAARTATADVVCLGESMVTFLPSQPGRLADVPTFGRGIGGAESNVACALAAAGHPAKWVSRVGADGFGDHLVDAVGRYGVDTSAVRRDPDRPTGIYFRTATDRATDTHEVAYYRAGSAASAMSSHNVPHEDLLACRILHLSGITAALSGDCRALLHDLTAPGTAARCSPSTSTTAPASGATAPRVTSCSASPAAATSSSSARTRRRRPGASAGPPRSVRRCRNRRCWSSSAAARAPPCSRGTPPRPERPQPTPSPTSPPCASTSSRPSAPGTPSPPDSSPRRSAASPYGTGPGTAT